MRASVTKSVVSVSARAAEAYTEQAQKATETVMGQTEHLVGQATKAAKVTDEQVASTAGATRNAVKKDWHRRPHAHRSTAG